MFGTKWQLKILCPPLAHGRALVRRTALAPFLPPRCDSARAGACLPGSGALGGLAMLTRRLIGVASTAVLAALALPTIASAQEKKTIRAVMHAPLRITDPIITTAYIIRNHGYMIYDTLFAMDEQQKIQPQMVEKYETSADKLTWTFTLRDGLKWHDGAPV